MSTERPTFSESWHRVAEMKPRLRASVKNYRQFYRGRMWHLLADPANNQFFRLDEPAYHFIALLDGRRDVATAWKIANEDLGDSAPTQGEAIQLLGQLYTSNLLQADLPPDSQQMFARHRGRIRREIGGYLLNFLFARIPLFDPQPMLRATVGLVGWIFGPIGFMFWCAAMATGFYFLAGRWDELLAQATPQSLLQTENIVLLYLGFIATKAIHELGHGYCCAHFGRKGGTGGPVHTIGIMLMVFVPVPYVDASSSWTFRNRWHRAFVGAAGMYVELVVAAMAAVVWSQTTDGTLLHDLAYNVMFIASVSTLLFNGNPLLRFDGYYILSDVLEIANLAQRSKQYLHYLVRKYVFGVQRARSSAHSLGERWWLSFYGVASGVYRVFVSIAILLYVADMFFVIGAIMAVGAVFGWVIVPLSKFAKYLSIGEELERVRPRAVTATVVFFLVVGGFIGALPMPDRDRAEGVVESVHMAMVHIESDGFVSTVLPSGTAVASIGKTLMTADNRALETELASFVADHRIALIKRELSRSEDPAVMSEYDHQIAAINRRITRVKKQITDLEIRAPFAGRWYTRDAQYLSGVFLPRGTRVGLIADPGDLIVRVSANQSLGPRIEPEIGVHNAVKVEMRVRNRPDVFMTGAIQQVLPGGQKDLPSPALGLVAGGSHRVSLTDESGTRTAEPFFEVHIKPDPAEASKLKIGQRVVVRFEMPSKPLAAQWWRSIQQLIQRRFSLPDA